MEKLMQIIFLWILIDDIMLVLSKKWRKERKTFEMRCCNCGKENKENANFCQFCSSKLNDTCSFCWVLKKSNYNCGKSSCPGRKLFIKSFHI